jgi:hypothetical protein
VCLVLLALVALALAASHSHKKHHSKNHHRAAANLRRHMHHKKRWIFSKDDTPITKPGYQAQDAGTKAKLLWDQINTPYGENRQVARQGLAAGVFNTGVAQGFMYSFSEAEDQMPQFFLRPERLKFIHPLGSVARVKWVKNPTGVAKLGLTGLYEEDETIGFVRLGWAGTPSDAKPAAIPGVGVKLMRDGAASSNFMVMVGLEGQGNDYNFFANTLTNHLPDPKSKAVGAGGKLFTLGTGSPYPTRLGTATIESIGADGKKVVAPKGAWKLEFVPVESTSDMFVKLQAAGKDHRETREALSNEKFAPGTKLWEVYAIGYPEPENKGDAQDKQVCSLLKDAISGSATAFQSAEQYETLIAEPALREHVATIVMDSNFVSSAYGDDKLFFQHQFFCDDQGANIGMYPGGSVARTVHVIAHSGALPTEKPKAEASWWSALWH